MGKASSLDTTDEFPISSKLVNGIGMCTADSKICNPISIYNKTVEVLVEFFNVVTIYRSQILKIFGSFLKIRDLFFEINFMSSNFNRM